MSTSTRDLRPRKRQRYLEDGEATAKNSSDVRGSNGAQDVKPDTASTQKDVSNTNGDHASKASKRKKKETVSTQPEDYPTRVQSDWKIGAHVSAAGGVENAVLNAAKVGANAFALFLKSQRKWEGPPLTDETVTELKKRLADFKYEPKHVLPHGNYLINLGNPDKEKREKAYNCFLDELKRCDRLGLPFYNFHPGSSVGQASVDECIAHIADCINRAHKETHSVVTVIENMAGAGNVLGGTFEEIAKMIELVEDKSRVGVCLDTCHTFASGYDLRSKEAYEKTMENFESVIGFKYLKGMHLNDSKCALNSKKDRHENIGLGELGLQAFRHIVTDARTKDVPLILETPGFDLVEVWKNEISILNQISTSFESGKHNEDSIDDSSLVEQLREVVKKAQKEEDVSKAKSSAKVGKAKSGKRKKKPVEDEESDLTPDEE